MNIKFSKEEISTLKEILKKIKEIIGEEEEEEEEDISYGIQKIERDKIIIIETRNFERFSITREGNIDNSPE